MLGASILFSGFGALACKSFDSDGEIYLLLLVSRQPTGMKQPLAVMAFEAVAGRK
jgi:hypothetical protein